MSRPTISFEPSTPAVLATTDATVLSRLRRTFLTLAALGFLGSWFLSASKGWCGTAEPQLHVPAPPCYQLTLTPSPFLYVLLGVVFLVALNVAIRHAGDAPAAVRMIDRTVVVAGVVVVVGIVIAQVWFWLIPTGEWDGSQGISFFSPFPFGSISLDVTPG